MYLLGMGATLLNKLSLFLFLAMCPWCDWLSWDTRIWGLQDVDSNPKSMPQTRTLKIHSFNNIQVCNIVIWIYLFIATIIYNKANELFFSCITKVLCPLVNFFSITNKDKQNKKFSQSAFTICILYCLYSLRGNRYISTEQISVNWVHKHGDIYWCSHVWVIYLSLLIPGIFCNILETQWFVFL